MARRRELAVTGAGKFGFKVKIQTDVPFTHVTVAKNLNT